MILRELTDREAEGVADLLSDAATDFTNKYSEKLWNGEEFDEKSYGLNAPRHLFLLTKDGSVALRGNAYDDCKCPYELSDDQARQVNEVMDTYGDSIRDQHDLSTQEGRSGFAVDLAKAGFALDDETGQILLCDIAEAA